MTQSVIISGGGIVGSFLGLELAARNIPFKIIEKKDFEISHTCLLYTSDAADE